MDVKDIALKVYVIVAPDGRFGMKTQGEFTEDITRARVFERLGTARSWVTAHVAYLTSYATDALAPADIPNIVELTARTSGVYNERKRVSKSRLKWAKKQERHSLTRMSWNVSAATKEFTKLQETIATLEQDVSQEEDYVAVNQDCSIPG